MYYVLCDSVYYMTDTVGGLASKSIKILKVVQENADQIITIKSPLLEKLNGNILYYSIL